MSRYQKRRIRSALVFAVVTPLLAGAVAFALSIEDVDVVDYAAIGLEDMLPVYLPVGLGSLCGLLTLMAAGAFLNGRSKRVASWGGLLTTAPHLVVVCLYIRTGFAFAGTDASDIVFSAAHVVAALLHAAWLAYSVADLKAERAFVPA